MSNPLTHPDNLQELADHLLLQQFSPPAVLVNEHGDIVYTSGRTGRYLEPAAGRANWNVHVMAHASFRSQLAAALRQARRDKSTVELQGLKVEEEMPGTLDIIVKAVQEPKLLAGMALIVFREITAATAALAQVQRPSGLSELSLAGELASSRSELSALRQEMRASEEELQASNEGLQSANEELTTSKEESQSMNEELQIINAELRTKLDYLVLAQSDMENLLNSTGIATLFLDNALNVRRFTQQMKRIVHFRDGDVGRPLSDLASTLIYPQLHEDAKETLRTLLFCEKQIPTTDGHWFNVRIMPYRTVENVIQGAVLTFVDITAAKDLEAGLRKTEPAGAE